jgi:hypothetical protein
VKGAIAFGLSAQIPTSLTGKRTYIVSTTLSIVLLSTIILGGLMSFFAKMVGVSKEKEMLKRMYASIGRDAGRKTMGRSMLSQYETGQEAEGVLPEGIKGRLIALKFKIFDYLIAFDQLVMK